MTAAVRRPEGLRDVSGAHSGRLTVEELDVTSSQDVARVDVVVNNAGGGLVGATEEMTDADVQHQIALNLLAPIQVTRAILKPMREQGAGESSRSERRRTGGNPRQQSIPRGKVGTRGIH